MPITILDLILLGVMLISGLLAMIRGFMREVLSIAAWAIAAVATLYFFPRLLPAAKQYFNNDLVANGVDRVFLVPGESYLGILDALNDFPGIDVVTCHVDGPKVVVETAEKRGAFTCGYHASQAKLAPKGYLTGAEWDWSTPYKQVVAAATEGKPMINFLRGGMKEGFVKMSAYGPSVSAKAKEAGDKAKAGLTKGDFVIFKGPLKDNKGATVIPAGTSLEMTNVELEKMNWLVEGVIGSIPA